MTNRLKVSLSMVALALVAGATISPVKFYGSLEQSYEWNNEQKVGIYSFTADASTGFTAEGLVQTGQLVTGGGAYADGYFYYINGAASYINVSNTFNKVDTDTWTVVATSGHTSPTKTDAFAMAYDYTTATMYASCPVRGTGTASYMLRTVDLNTGEMTDVAALSGYFPAIAFDASGQLWGVRRPDEQYGMDAELHKIDKATGATVKVGSLGYKQKSDYAGMVFDYRTGRLYWTSRCYTYNSAWEETYTSYLMELDTATGAATPLKTFDYSEVMATIFIKDCHPQAPEAATALTFGYTTDNAAALSFTVPSRRYDGSALTGAVKAEVIVDGQLSQTLTGLTVGSTATTQSIALTDGSHSVRVYCYDAQGHRSVAADTKVWGGRDVPAKVEGITLNISPRGDKAVISWQAPTTSKSGGNCDLSQLTYNVIRRPDRQTVATGLKETTYTDTPSRSMLLSQYEIVAVAPSGSSDPAYSTPALIGAAYPVTYLETFDNTTQFNTYTIIDVNGVGSSEGDRWMWYPSEREAIYWLNYGSRNRADAWMVTPTIDLKTDGVYRLSFTHRGYSDINTNYTLTAAVGELPTAAALDREIFRYNGTFSKKGTTDHHALFLAEDGDCRIGIRLQSPGDDHCGLDNVRVAWYGPSTIPAAPALVSVAKNGETAAITVTAPTTDAKGRAITSLTALTLFREGSSTPVATVQAPAPGTDVVLTDPTPAAGENNYVVTAANADGRGLETLAFIDMRVPAPRSVEQVSVAGANDGTDVVISWQYPASMTAADGTPVNPSDITYDIYRGESLERTPVARGLRTTTYTDRDVMAAYPNDRQKRLGYYVVAVTTGGQSAEAGASVMVGSAYELPYVCDNFYENPTRPWTSDPVTAWQAGTNGYTPKASPYAGVSMMRCYPAGVAVQYWTSPRFNLSGLSAPAVKFMLYCQDSEAAATASIEVGIVREQNGVEQPMELVPGSLTSCRDTRQGWREVTVDLSAYAAETRASIVFVAHSTSQYWVYLDHLSIDGSKLDRDMRVAAFDCPATAVRGRDNAFSATVANNGMQAISGATVALSVDGETVDSKTVSLDPDGSQQVDFSWTPALNGEEYTARVSVTVTAAGDGNPYNDAVSRAVEVIVPNVPYVNDLAGSYDHATGQVVLTWSEAVQYPGAKPVKDDFESYDDYAIDGIGQWKLVDADGTKTMAGITSPYGSLTWTNCGLPQAYIVFNPVRAGIGALATAFSGDRCLVSFSSSGANDDWLISPALLGAAQQISFHARAMNSAYPNEKLEVLVSRTGSDIADFESVRTISVNTDVWTAYNVALPDGARYFALRCVSAGQFALMIDDIEYIPAQPSVDLLGYNVYRDGEVIASAIGETEYTDVPGTATDSYDYNVAAVYDDGESIWSNTVTLSPAGISDAMGAGSVIVRALPGAIEVSGAQGLPLLVASVDGRVVYNLRAAAAAETLPVAPGLYLVSVAGKSVKLIVK